MAARATLCGRFGISKWSSDDKYPLTRAMIAELVAFFRSVRVSYPEFFFFHYLDAKLFEYRSPRVSRACRNADSLSWRYLPFLGPYSYRQVVCCEAPRPR